jgi:flagellar FliJ protein
MKEKFNFRFQKVLDFRIEQRKQKGIELASCLARMEEEKDELYRLLETRTGIFNRMFENRDGSIAAIDLKQYGDYLQYLQRFIDIQRKSLHQIEREVECCREELVEASTEQKAMEKLRDRYYSRFLYQLEKQRERYIEEVVNHRVASN